MQETVGMLNLKISQLEHRAGLLKKQQLLSQAYPDHQANLRQQEVLIRNQLDQLLRRRGELLQYRLAA